ncbi:C40 family peptidase [Streptomyces sp. TP-A0874]|uniref:C40 family peptidase n=1 Tax=Streptomyces sp. TP-A0874 TaxID=549819 RepID=UPI0008529589|nr:C40 family peptidase [Streptomyces sp. TP-A0874]
MSKAAHSAKHRKPRSRASVWGLRAGVATGVLGTLAASAAFASSLTPSESAAAQVAEVPALNGSVSEAAQRSSDATLRAALDYDLRDQQRTTAAAARKSAKESAGKKAEQAARKAAQRRAEQAGAEEQRAAERASRSTARPALDGAAKTATTTAAKTAATATDSAASVLAFLESQLGKAYVLGATGPSAYDCSGLTQAAFRTVGVELPRVSQDQSTVGTPVSLDSLLPGDLLFWGGTGSAYHVAVYVGDGQYIDAANPGKGVVKQDLSYSPPTSARRVL